MRLDLRGFMDWLEKEGELVRITKPVSINRGIAAYIRKSCDIGGPAFIFENVTEFPGQKVCGGIYGTKKRIGMALGFADEKILTPRESLLKYTDALKSYSKGALDRPIILHKSDAPCKEVINLKPDLSKLPICTYNDKDKGPFITAGIQVVKDDRYGTQGVGIHRMFVIDNTHLSCLAPIERRVGRPYYRASEQNKSIPIAIVIGASPADMLASQAKIPHSDEKFNVVKQLLNKFVTLVKCETSDLLVPVDAELVIEGRTVPNSSFNDVPFGEYPGTYSMRTNAWIVEVTAITHRENYIFEALLTGMPPQEDSNLCGVPTAAFIYNDASYGGSEVVDVSTYLGNNVFDTVVSINKKNNSEVHNLLYRLIGNNYVKSVTVVDSDIDVNSENEIRWAMNTRMQPDRDIVITTHQLHGASLDPSGPLFRSTSKIGYDCTRPIGLTKEDTELSVRRHEKALVGASNDISWKED